jgi:hypothetical protein
MGGYKLSITPTSQLYVPITFFGIWRKRPLPADAGQVVPTIIHLLLSFSNQHFQITISTIVGPSLANSQNL